MEIDYTNVTEIPGSRVSQEQLERMFHRYAFAAQYSTDKRVLELGCGAGSGLGYLRKRARRVVAGDYTENLLRIAQTHYREKIPLLRLDAQSLPFRNQCFDVVILYEAIYYLAKPELFVLEAKRVLSIDGILLIATVNKDWPEFNPSPFSTRYFSVPELGELLKKNGFKVELYGAFSSLPKTFREAVIATVRKIAVALHLIPKTMKGKEFLKRLFYGKLKILKEELEEEVYDYLPPAAIRADLPNSEYKVIYAVAKL